MDEFVQEARSKKEQIEEKARQKQNTVLNIDDEIEQAEREVAELEDLLIQERVQAEMRQEQREHMLKR